MSFEVVVRKPETDCNGICNHAAWVSFDLEDGFPIIVGDGKCFPVIFVYYGLDAFVFSGAVECRSCDYVERVFFRDSLPYSVSSNFASADFRKITTYNFQKG